MKQVHDTKQTLVRENNILKRKIEELTRELNSSKKERVNYFLDIPDGDDSFTEKAYQNDILRNAAGMLEERHRLAAEKAGEILSIVDHAGIYVWANARAAALHGLQTGELVGQSIFRILDPDLAERYRTEILRPVTTENKEVRFKTHFRKGKSRLQLEINCQPIHDGFGNVTGVLNITHDCTAEQKTADYFAIEQSINLITSFSSRLEETIREVFFKLSQADFIIAGGLYLFNDDTRKLDLISHFNLPDDFISEVMSYGEGSPQYEIVFRGIPQYNILPELPGQIRHEIETMENRTVSVIPLIHDKRIIGSLNLLLSDLDQITWEDKSFIETIGWRIARIINLHDTQKKLQKTVEELNDTIGDLKIKQQMLIQKSKMESLGELSAGMAHEINQPLVIISLSIENIMQKMVMEKKNLSVAYLGRKFESILKNISRIQQIIDNMRIFARDQSSILFEKVNVGNWVSKTLEMVGVQYRSEGVKISCANVDEKANVIGNIFKLEQVLLNLLSNSRYSLLEKFKVTADPGFQKQIDIKAVKVGNELIVDVFDNGIGIPEEHIDKLFTPFFTTKREGAGTGLGLPIVYGIVKEMNGAITVTSKQNEFTNVRIVLPAV